MANEKDEQYLTLDELLDMDEEDQTTETKWAYATPDVHGKLFLNRRRIYKGPWPPRRDG